MSRNSSVSIFRKMCMICVMLISAVSSALAADLATEMILTRQRLYFQSINSLEFRQTVTITRVIQSKPSPVDVQEGTIAVHDERHFSEVKLTSGPRISSAFDGQNYQFLAGDSTLLISKNPLNKNPYNGFTVVTAPFVFAFGDDDELSIRTLRASKTWERRLQDVVSATETVMKGKKGTLLSFACPDNPSKIVEAFFAKDMDYLPIHVKLTFKDDDIISEVDVVATKTVTTESGELAIPMLVSTKDYSLDGANVQNIIMEVNAETLQVNQAVDSGKFTISRSNVKHINYVDFDLLVPGD